MKLYLLQVKIIAQSLRCFVYEGNAVTCLGCQCTTLNVHFYSFKCDTIFGVEMCPVLQSNLSVSLFV